MQHPSHTQVPTQAIPRHHRQPFDTAGLLRLMREITGLAGIAVWGWASLEVLARVV